MITTCASYLNIYNTAFCPLCIYGFHMIVRINGNHFPNSINHLAFVTDMQCFL
jgi:hypothetical protein